MLQAKREWAQKLVNKRLKKMFDAGEDADLNLIYDKLFEMGFSEKEAVDMIDEAVFCATGK